MGFWAHVLCLLSLLGLAVAWAKALIFLLSPFFPFLHPWASRLLILPYHFIVPTIALHFLLLHDSPWTCGLMFLPHQPTSSSIFCLGLLRPTFTSLPLLGFVGRHSYCASPFHYFIPWASSAFLLHLYLFYFHGLFVRSFGLPRSNYHIFISYYFLGLLAFMLTHRVY